MIETQGIDIERTLDHHELLTKCQRHLDEKLSDWFIQLKKELLAFNREDVAIACLNLSERLEHQYTYEVNEIINHIDGDGLDIRNKRLKRKLLTFFRDQVGSYFDVDFMAQLGRAFSNSGYSSRYPSKKESKEAYNEARDIAKRKRAWELAKMFAKLHKIYADPTKVWQMRLLRPTSFFTRCLFIFI